MPDTDPPEFDRRKIRLGLAIISLVVVAALIGVIVIDAPAGRALMFAIAAMAMIRAYVFSRSLRRETKGTG